jgi:hypothetical protein
MGQEFASTDEQFSASFAIVRFCRSVGQYSNVRRRAMRRMRMIGLLSVVVVVGAVLAAAPRYLKSIEVTSDPVELLQRRIDVLELQLQELTERVGTAEVVEPLVTNHSATQVERLAGK